MMPLASNRIAIEKPLFERRTVVRADGPDREHLFAAPGKQHRFALRMSEQHGSIGDRCELDALGEIGPAEFRLFLTHSNLLDADAVLIRFYCALGNTGIRATDLRLSLSSDPSN